MCLVSVSTGIGRPALIGCPWSSQRCRDGQRAQMGDPHTLNLLACLGEEVLRVPVDIGKVRIAGRFAFQIWSHTASFWKLPGTQNRLGSSLVFKPSIALLNLDCRDTI